jgi:hypothetical protein
MLEKARTDVLRYSNNESVLLVPCSTHLISVVQDCDLMPFRQQLLGQVEPNECVPAPLSVHCEQERNMLDVQRKTWLGSFVEIFRNPPMRQDSSNTWSRPVACLRCTDRP